MLPDRVSNPGPLTYESDALPIALRGPAGTLVYYTVESGHMSYFLCTSAPDISNYWYFEVNFLGSDNLRYHYM